MYGTILTFVNFLAPGIYMSPGIYFIHSVALPAYIWALHLYESGFNTDTCKYGKCIHTHLHTYARINTQNDRQTDIYIYTHTPYSLWSDAVD